MLNEKVAFLFAFGECGKMVLPLVAFVNITNRKENYRAEIILPETKEISEEIQLTTYS